MEKKEEETDAVRGRENRSVVWWVGVIKSLKSFTGAMGSAINWVQG